MNVRGGSQDSIAWYAGLTPMHGRILLSSFLGWVFDGYETFAIFIAAFPIMRSILPNNHTAPIAVYVGGLAAATLLGWGAGGMIGGIIADYIGRKRMMLWSVFLYAIFTGITAISQTYIEILAFRFLTGLALGSEWGTGIALVNETWPENARAKGDGFLQSGFGWGSLLAAVVWYAISATAPLGDQSWRLMFLVGILPAFFILYIRKGIDESQKWVDAVRSKKWGATDARSLQTEKRPFTLSQVFSEPTAKRRAILAFILSLVTTIGWWAISSFLRHYAIQVGTAQGFVHATAQASKISIYYTIGAIIAYVSAGFIIDKIGRRWFIFFSFLGSILTTLAVYKGASTIQEITILSPINGFFTLGCAYVWMAIYPSELFATTLRGTAISFIFNAARLIAWIFPILAGSIIVSFGGVSNAALIIGSVYILGLILPWFMPETTGHGIPD